MSTTTKVSRLRCEYLANPLGIDEKKPRLSWVIESDRRGTYQVGRRVLVASCAQLLAEGKADLWDSGRIEDDRSAHIVYEGVPLTSRQTCHWQLQIWDDQGASVISKPAFWTMGLLKDKDWQADWIAADLDYLNHANHAIKPTLTEPGTPPWFRKIFNANDSIRKATLYTSARGLLELYLNGRRIGNDIFVPEWTDYDKRIHYRTYDVTELIRAGKNVLGAILGDGWYSGFVGWQETRGRYGLQNSLLVQLEVTLTDGSTQIITSNDSWKCSAGPILSSDFMIGETYDARCELIRWDQPDYDDNTWSKVCIVAPPAVPLVAQRSEPVQIIETKEPVSARISPAGSD